MDAFFSHISHTLRDAAPLTVTGVLGALCTAALGSWSFAVQSLCILLVLDYIMGLVVAGVFHQSPKSEDGCLESLAGWKGLLRKCAVLFAVAAGEQCDRLLGTAFIRDGVIYAFCANEVLSLIENAGLMGLPVAEPLRSAITLLRQRSGEEKEEKPGGGDE